MSDNVLELLLTCDVKAVIEIVKPINAGHAGHINRAYSKYLYTYKVTSCYLTVSRLNMHDSNIL